MSFGTASQTWLTVSANRPHALILPLRFVSQGTTKGSTTPTLSVSNIWVQPSTDLNVH